MDALQATTATADAVSAIGSHFMLDGGTYKAAAELGFAGLDFYVRGRGGVLGEVDADVVTAALAFFAPDQVRSLWEAGRGVMPAAEAATAFAAACHRWADRHVPEDLDAARLAELSGQVVARAGVACAPVFAGWRALDVPSDPKRAAVHHMNALRELRFALHAAAVTTAGLTPLQAMSVRSPHMIPLFGWAGPVDVEGLEPVWQGAEDRTNEAFSAVLGELSDAERAELVDLVNALHGATKG